MLCYLLVTGHSYLMFQKKLEQHGRIIGKPCVTLLSILIRLSLIGPRHHKYKTIALIV